MPLAPGISPTFAPGHSFFDIIGNWTAYDNDGYYVAGADTSNTINTRGGSDYLQGFGGNDRLFSGDGDDLVKGGDGNDTISGDGGDDWLYGDYQEETIFAVGDDFILGGSGNDYLFGGAGSDTLEGGADNDTLEGGTGNDLLTGDSGADVFRFDLSAESGTTDTITDYEDGVDLLHYILPASYEIYFLDAATYSPGADGTLVYDAVSDHVTYLEGIDEQLITLDDFTFEFL